MKTIIFITLLLGSFVALADEQTCEIAGLPMYDLPQELQEVHAITAAERRNFQARTMYPAGGWTMGLRIETNFKVPFVGNQNYFGKIFFKKGDTSIRYRDEILARDFYREETANPMTYHTASFGVANMNRPGGSEVGTGVKLIGSNFNTNTGGRLTISVKPPGSSRMNVPFDVQVVNGRAVPSLNVGGRRIVFDTLKINSNSAGILSGVDNVQLFSNGRVVYTIDN